MDQTLMNVGPAPTLHPDGTLRVQGVTSSVDHKVRHGVPLGPDKVIPVVFVPGIMGSNLITVPRNAGEKPEIAWRPPNGNYDGVQEGRKWEKRDPASRQALLDPDATAVDETAPVLAGSARERSLFRQRGWHTIHHDSYGDFLYLLHQDLNRTLESHIAAPGLPLQPCSHWRAVMQADRGTWDAADMPALTLADLEKSSDYQYPVYAFGYNWLQSNARSAEHLAGKIEGWIGEWKNAGYRCEQVILVTHSMGGLVARAYARQHADKVLGVVHAVMPALGAPACYRRMACGTEQSASGNSDLDNYIAGIVATIMGRTPAETQPVLGVSPGPLELLPTHLHAPGWLKVDITSRRDLQPRTVLELPVKDSYQEIYRNTNAWFRMVDPELLDPGNKYAMFKPGSGLPPGPLGKFHLALNQAESFHKDIVGNYYHSNTYAFYGQDYSHISFGSVRWEGRWPEFDEIDEKLLRTSPPSHVAPMPGQVTVELGTPGPIAKQAHQGAVNAFEGTGASASPLRNPTIDFVVQPQDVPGDGTVAWQSGASPKGQPGVQRLFKATGFDHQGAYNDQSMRQLTCYLICKIAQGAA